MKFQHTKSPSGRTHRLTATRAARTIAPQPKAVVLRFIVAPKYDDQVQGDLVRKLRREHDIQDPIGWLPTHVDPDLKDLPAPDRAEHDMVVVRVRRADMRALMDARVMGDDEALVQAIADLLTHLERTE